MRWVAVVLIALAVGGAAGVAGGYAYTSTRDEPTKSPGVYCYNPEPGPHLNGDPVKRVCVPTGR